MSDLVDDHVGRARYDPTRRVGQANDVAMHRQAPPISAVVSSTELQRWSEIIESPRKLAERREHRAELSKISKAREAQWPDTLHARHHKYKQDRIDRLEAEEVRRQAIDAEEAQLREARHAQQMETATAQLVQRDERMKQLQSVLLLHHVLMERDEQVGFNKVKENNFKCDQKDEGVKLRAAAVTELEENQHGDVEKRQRATEVKSDNFNQLYAQLEQARKTRAQRSEVHEKLRLEALEEQRDNEAAREHAHTATCVVKEHNKHAIATAATTSSSTSPRSPRQRIEHLKAVGEEEEKLRQSHELQRLALQKHVAATLQQRNDRHTAAVSHAATVLNELLAKPSPREFTAAVVAQKPSLLTEMGLQDDKRVAESLRLKRQLASLPSPTGTAASGTDESPTVSMNSGRRRKERVGDVSVEERNRLRAMLDRQVTELEQLEAEEATQQRIAATKLKEIQRMQAEEKREQQRLVADEYSNAIKSIALKQEEEMFRKLIAEKLPAGMSPRLAAKAVASPRGHRE